MQALGDGFSGVDPVLELVDPLKGRVLNRAEAGWDAPVAVLECFTLPEDPPFSPLGLFLLGLGRGRIHPSGNGLPSAHTTVGECGNGFPFTRSSRSQF